VAKTAQQLAMGRVQVAVVVEVEPFDYVEGRLRAIRFCHRDGPAQLDHR
jgi:hypothetical protein